MKTPRERLGLWKKEMRNMPAEEAVRLLIEIAEQAVRENDELRQNGGHNG